MNGWKKKLIDILISVGISTAIYFLQQLLTALAGLQVSDAQGAVTSAAGGLTYLGRAFKVIV